MTTIRDVAKAAGVGLGTVSRVLNQSPLVSDGTRERVLQVIEELNYTPNRLARRLSLGKTLTIAVVLPFFTRPAFSERLSGVASVLSRTHYDLLIHNIDTPELRRDFFENLLPHEVVDGMLILSLPLLDHEAGYLLEKANIPLVLIDSDHSRMEGQVHQLTVDDVAGGRLATRYLLDLGHTKIGFIGDLLENPFNFTSSGDRYRGYCEELKAAGIERRAEYYAVAEHGRHQACVLAQEMLALPDPPTAIFAASDTQAVGVLEAARKTGVRVPEDLSVVGYDDIELADIMQLTTVRQMLFESGRRGVEILLETLKAPQLEIITEELPLKLVVRESTAAPSR